MQMASLASPTVRLSDRQFLTSSAFYEFRKPKICIVSSQLWNIELFSPVDHRTLCIYVCLLCILCLRGLCLLDLGIRPIRPEETFSIITNSIISLTQRETSDLTQYDLDGDWVRAVKCDDGSEECIVLRSAGQDTAADTTEDDLDTEDLKDDERERDVLVDDDGDNPSQEW